MRPTATLRPANVVAAPRSRRRLSRGRGFVLASIHSLSTSVPLVAQLTPSQVPPALELAGDQILVNQATAGGRVLFFGLAHHRPAHTLRIVRHEEVAVDEDRDGAVSFDSPRLTRSASAVAVIDLETGGLALGRIDSLEGRAIPVPGSGGRSQGGVGGELLDLPGLAQVELVLVRPGSGAGSGAWGLRGGDGGGQDESGVPGEQDGRIVAPLSAFWSIGTSEEPPATLATGDLLVVLDPHDLAVGAFELGVEGWVAR